MSKFEFSNFQELDEPFVYQGLTFSTVEHFYCAMKTKDLNLRKKIAGMEHPAQAKKYAAAIPLREDWKDIKLDVMRYALNIKFKEGSSYRERLMKSEGQIVEWNRWHDNYWGECTCHKCRARPEEVMAQNHLGKLLMQIRDKQ